MIAVLGAAFSAPVFGLGLATIVLTLSAHGIHHLPAGVGRLYLGTVISSAAGLVLAGYAIALLVAASRTTMRRDVA